MKEYISRPIKTVEEFDSYRGTLDYLEFIVSPSNEITDETGLINAVLDYFSLCGYSSSDVREEMLATMKVVRRRKAGELVDQWLLKNNRHGKKIKVIISSEKDATPKPIQLRSTPFKDMNGEPIQEGDTLAYQYGKNDYVEGTVFYKHYAGDLESDNWFIDLSDYESPAQHLTAEEATKWQKKLD